jgi:capsular exopolysaccharide synthesis family protein
MLDRVAERIAPTPGRLPDAAAETAFRLAPVLAALRRRQQVFLGCALLVPLLTAVAVGRMVPHYTAVGAVVFEPGEYAARELQSILRSDPATDAVLNSQVEIVRSLSAAAELLDKLNLAERAEFNADLRRPGVLARIGRAVASVPPIAWFVGGPASPTAPEAKRARLLQAVQSAIGVQVVRGSQVLQVSFSSTDPVLAATAANLVMQYYIDQQLESKFEAVRRASAWLEGRVADLRQEVRDAEDRIAAYRASQGLFQGVQAGIDTEQISRLTADLVQARADLAHVEGRLKAARGHAGAADQAAVAPSVAQLRAQQDQLAAQLQAVMVRLGPNHPEALGLEHQLAEMSRAVNAEVARTVAAAEADLRASRARVSALEAALQRSHQQVDTSAQAQVPLNAMQREADAARGLLATVLERMQQTTQQTAIEKADARIISRALPPAGPSFPKPTLMVGLAAVCGLMLGGTLAYVLELIDNSLHSGEDGRRWFGLPCFALLPELTSRQLGRLRVDEYVAYKPLSPFAEQLRALRAGLFLGGLSPVVVAITAARPAEGKTALALALGRSCAMAGERVLVLDCDVREPALGRLMKADAESGLTDVLLGFAQLQDVVRPDELTGLRYIPAGSPQADSAALFTSAALTALLVAARQHYDLILLDAPPALAMADARLVSRLADATVLCVRWRQTPRAVVSHALDLLAEAQAHVCGLVLTRVDARQHGRAGYADSDIYTPRYGGYFHE